MVRLAKPSRSFAEAPQRDMSASEFGQFLKAAIARFGSWQDYLEFAARPENNREWQQFVAEFVAT